MERFKFISQFEILHSLVNLNEIKLDETNAHYEHLVF